MFFAEITALLKQLTLGIKDLYSVKASKTWTLIGTSTGTNRISIDLTNYTEILISATFYRNGVNHISVVTIPKVSIPETGTNEIKMTGGSISSSNGCGTWCRIIDQNEFHGQESQLIGESSKLSITTWKVYAR